MHKNRVKNDRIVFLKFFTLLSCEWENSAENEAEKIQKIKRAGYFKNISKDKKSGKFQK